MRTDNWRGACGSCRELEVRDWEAQDTETPRFQIALGTLSLKLAHVNGQRPNLEGMLARLSTNDEMLQRERWPRNRRGWDVQTG